MPAYPGSTKNVLRNEYGAFVNHLNTCQHCTVYGVKFCDAGATLRGEARSNIFNYIDNFDTVVAETTASADRGAESQKKRDYEEEYAEYLGWFG